LNAILNAGGLTNNASTTLTGSGTNIGPVEINGILSPGTTGTPGTFSIGGGLTVQGGAALNMDFTTNNTPGAGVNDLIQVTGDVTMSGGIVNVNPIGLLKTGQPYRLINYTGNLIFNSDFSYNSPNNYTFTTDTNTLGQINIIPSAGPPIWTG